MTGKPLSRDQTVSAAIVVIGDEILSGRTRDTNTGTIAAALTAIGIRLLDVRVVPDNRERIVEAVNSVRARYDYVFTTGGIGPTHDDITADAIAAALALPVVMHAEAEALLRAHYGGDITDARLRMARMPEGARLIANRVSVAPGFAIANIFVMAGVPAIMQAMLDVVLPRLKTGPVLRSQTIDTGLAEGLIGTPLKAIQDRHGHVSIGSYPYFTDNGYATQVVIRATNEEALARACDAVRDMIAALKEQNR